MTPHIQIILIVAVVVIGLNQGVLYLKNVLSLNPQMQNRDSQGTNEQSILTTGCCCFMLATTIVSVWLIYIVTILDGRVDILKAQLTSVHSPQNCSQLLPSPDPIQQSPPAGYIYFQFPTKSSHVNIWPNHSWREVTHDFKGLFFRAFDPLLSDGSGGSSEAFDSNQVVVQEGSCPVLQKITYVMQHDPSWNRQQQGQCYPYSTDLTPGVPATVITGFHHTHGGEGCAVDGAVYEISDSQVKPRNTALRIWERV